MKKLMMMLMLMPMMSLAYETWTDSNTGISWKYVKSNGAAALYGNREYNKDTRKYDVTTAISSATTGAITIPSYLGGCPVTKINLAAFYGCNKLTAVTIPSSVESIGSRAFSGCSGLTSVTIPASVTSIGTSAFSGCSSLADENGFVIVKDVLYDYCGEATSVIVPFGVTCIDGAFEDRSSLVSVEIPKSVSCIGDYAFYGCAGLTSVTIPPSVTSIGSDAFACCTSLVSVEIPSSVTIIGYEAFYECSGLTSVTIHEGAEIIGQDAFSGCEKIQTITLPSTLVRLGDRDNEYLYSVFSGCRSLRAVYYCSSLPPIVSVSDLYYGTPATLISYIGWEMDAATDKWCGRDWQHWDPPTGGTGTGGGESESGSGGGTTNYVYITVTNVVEHYTTVTNTVEHYYYTEVTNVVEHYYYTTVTNIVNSSEEYHGESETESGGGTDGLIWIATTNVAVNYVLNSVQPQFAIPASSDVGFVNIIAEVRGGCVAVPATWMVNYPNFISKYGSDFTKALAMKSGKKDGAGNEMLVWQDYVAGTDPTDENDVFRASITIVDGKVTISYTPELDDARKAMRKYTTWGKTSLMDTDWTEVQDGHEAEFNFFKVSVEMR